MSQPSSPQSPRHSASSSGEETRRLISPQERFGEESSDKDSPATTPTPDPFVAEPSLSTLRRDDEMARRHLPPHERRRHARTLKKRAKREANYREATQHREAPVRPIRERVPHEQRAEAEREFALQARELPPVPVKKTRRRVPVALKRLLGLICVLFVGQLVFAAFTAPQFNIQSVAINGHNNTPPEQLRPLASKLIGQNLLRANRKAVEKAVMALPTVAEAHVTPVLSWPPKSELRIVERQPVIKVGAGDDWWVADSHGVTFRRPTADDAALYAVVSPKLEPQLSRPLNPNVWKRVAALNTAILNDNRLAAGETAPEGDGTETAATTGQSQNGFWHLRRIYFDKNGLASLRFKGQGELASQNEVLVRLGDDRWGEKLARARVALGYFQRTGRRAAELDLVSFERPVWLPVQAQLASDKTDENESQSAG